MIFKIFLLSISFFAFSCGESDSNENANLGSDLNGQAEGSAKSSFPDWGTELDTCKSVEGSPDAEATFLLKNKNWCGDFKGRFKKKADAPRMDYVYDQLLGGFWSPSSSSEMQWSYAQSYCINYGSGWLLPDAYQLLSLMSQYESNNLGYINPIFEDNNQNWFWSSSSESSSEAWYLDFNLGRMEYNDTSKKNHVRCFRSADFE